MGEPAFSDDGRYLGGVKAAEKRGTAWILDTRSGRVVRRTSVPYSDLYDIGWAHGRLEIGEELSKKIFARLSVP